MTLPIPLSLILCDAIITDRATNKLTLAGTFSDIGVSELPAIHPEFSVLCELTNGHGEHEVTIKICRPTAESVDGETLWHARAPIPFQDPRAIARIMWNFKQTEFRSIGEHRVIIEVDGVLLIERRLVVRKVSP